MHVYRNMASCSSSVTSLEYWCLDCCKLLQRLRKMCLWTPSSFWICSRWQWSNSKTHILPISANVWWIFSYTLFPYNATSITHPIKIVAMSITWLSIHTLRTRNIWETAGNVSVIMILGVWQIYNHGYKRIYRSYCFRTLWFDLISILSIFSSFSAVTHNELYFSMVMLCITEPMGERTVFRSEILNSLFGSHVLLQSGFECRRLFFSVVRHKSATWTQLSTFLANFTIMVCLDRCCTRWLTWWTYWEHFVVYYACCHAAFDERNCWTAK